MHLWTIQSKQVVDLVMQGESDYYFPDFTRSATLATDYQGMETASLYEFLLFSWKRVNGGRIPQNIMDTLQGLVFCFGGLTDDSSALWGNYQECLKALIAHSDNIRALWNYFDRLGECYLLDIDWPEGMGIDLLPVEYNNWQALMPPITVAPPFSHLFLYDILNTMLNGEICGPAIPSGFVQYHIPFISKAMLSGIYDLPRLPDMNASEEERMALYCFQANASNLLVHPEVSPWGM